METPLYEYDQVLTCPELANVTEQLIAIYDITSKWMFIARLKLRIQIATVVELHQALHMKTQLMNNHKETTHE